MSYTRTLAVNKLLKLSKRIRVIPGGTWAGKTYCIIADEIDYLSRVKTDLTVVAETIPAVKKGAFKDFLDIMRDTNRYNPNSINWSDRIYTFYNGSTIEFTAFDNEDKAKQAGKRSRLFVNEANTINKNIIDALMIRTEDVIWLDYNPTARYWVNEELEHDPDAEWLTLTYRDNEALPDTILNELLKRREKAKNSEYWANWCRVYLDGEIGSLEGVVFNNWTTIKSIPHDARLIGIGLDFGYTNDPTAIVEVYTYNNKRILNEICYRTGLVNDDISDMLPKEMIIWADSAEPKSIEEIKRSGFYIKGVTKGADSIKFGIQIMQGQEYLVTEDSTNLIKELRNYSWDVDKTGERLNKPIDKYNHAIDAVRYHEMESIGLDVEFFTF